ncbi:DUF1456 family protein [Orbus wheelerorum]|uniref:DUF1456 family protein n=1 Tax=Orbus wheelerorum TaxID=3074111 RepID=UPI00370D803E
MENNDTLRSVRYMLNLSDAQMLDIIKLAGLEVDILEMNAWLKPEDAPDYKICSDYVMVHFLNGLIIFRRGKDDRFPIPEVEPTVTNNIIMKKLRAAFALKDCDLIDIYTSVDFRVSKPELSAIFRKADHKNYRKCGDQLLRYFLKGLTLKIRG